MQVTTQNSTVPKLRFKEFVGDWKPKLFQDISNDFSYGLNSAAGKFDGVNKYIRITDIDDVSRMYCPRPLTSPVGEINEKFVLKKNDIVFARTGASVGKSYIYKQADGKLLFAGFLIRMSVKNACSEFIFYETLRSNYNKWVKVFSMRSGQPGLNAEEFKSYRLNLPTLPEQQKIASFLSAVDERIQKLERKKSLLAAYKKGVMRQLFSQEIRFRDENGNNYPDWEEKKLGEIISFLSDYTANGSFGALKENVQYYSAPNHAALVRTTDLEKNEFIPQRFTDERGYNFLKKTPLYGGEIIMANVGSIGKVYRTPKGYKGLMTLAPNTYMIKFNLSIEEDFIFQVMLTTKFKNKLLSMVGSSTLKAINKSNLRSIKINIPQIDEQQKIAFFLNGVDKKIALVETQIQQSKTFKKGLLQQMFV